MSGPVGIRSHAPARLLPTTPAPEALAHHRAAFGPLPHPGAALIDELERSGLTGRGGAGFPAAIKWRAVAARVTRMNPGVVVGDAVETEPASVKDRTLLALRPHLVLDGMQLACEAVGATRAILYVSRANDALLRALRSALADRPDVEVPVEVHDAPTRYVAGEETAVVNRLNGRAARPNEVPPRPFDAGVDRRPTLLNNVETLAHAALIARHGAAWFRQAGTADSPGTTLITLCGAVRTPGVREVSYHQTLGEVVEAAGGVSAEPGAVLLGGYFGRWVSVADIWDRRFERSSLRQIHASIGAGVVALLPKSSCGVAETDRILAFLARESAGQCGPCHVGLPALSEQLHAVSIGRAGPRSFEVLGRWSEEIRGRGACRHPDGATLLTTSALEVFADDFRRHIRDGACRASRRAPLLPTPVLSGGWR
ncbi:MAG: proton-conducting membrane transporter [Candidatus Dormibacteraeota bacterium]|nr:proton-conducting membrane transporter [Candidatus Dormibacteraeota bacterium]